MAEKKLYDSATIGDLATLKQLLQTNQHLLDVVSLTSCLKNVLHIAIKKGHESIVAEVLKINPELSLELDSNNSSSLHLAAAKGNAGIANRLMEIAPEMCWWRDGHDMNPLHVAAVKGNEAVLKEMLRLDAFVAAARLHHRQTVLQLCVKHRQLGTLKVLVEELGDTDLVNAKDDDGETLLHFAVRTNQLEVVEYMKGSGKVERLTKNFAGKTALDILNESFRNTSTYPKMKTILKSFSSRPIALSLPRFTELTIVAAILIATMAFQAAVSPPGGVWSQNKPKDEPGAMYYAGQAVMATIMPSRYRQFIRVNIVSFISSLVAILFLATAGSSDQWIFALLALISMLVSMASIGVTYGASLIMTNPFMKDFGLDNSIIISACVFAGVMFFIFVISSFRSGTGSVKRIIKKIGPTSCNFV
ncbi:ankyrin repeat-containing protein At5g02620-like [Salvia hispanica]|uniref:ankyrin repeat-containing protein At5g02620-like n=1 Tax=Salvia hispanica TaxID=49212 RepID=UPI002009B63B|nr:ankyrin repeat-containing protein At5g02620-like [Salvia hispanica]